MMLSLFGGGVGWQELLVILVVLLLLFGAKRLPELARSLGRSMSEFKKGREDGAALEEKKEPETEATETPADKSGDAG